MFLNWNFIGHPQRQVRLPLAGQPRAARRLQLNCRLPWHARVGGKLIINKRYGASVQFKYRRLRQLLYFQLSSCSKDINHRPTSGPLSPNRYARKMPCLVFNPPPLPHIKTCMPDDTKLSTEHTCHHTCVSASD